MTTEKLSPGEFLRSRRQEQNLSMAKAGARAVPPLTSSYIAQLEAGDITAPRVDRVERIAQAYGLGSPQLLSIFGLELDPEVITCSEAYEVGRAVLDLAEPHRSNIVGFTRYLRNEGIA